MKHLKPILACALAATMLFGCGKKEEPKETEVKEEPIQKEVQEEPETVLKAENPDMEQIPDGMFKSYLTGEYVPVDVGNKRPVAIMLNNIKVAVPQAGIANAGVVYEAPVEGGITRLMGIFEDYGSMEKIGSVRSCRTYYVNYAQEFNAIYTHFGQAVYAVDLLNSPGIDNISGLAKQKGAGDISGYAGEDIFYRTTDRKSPHNVYTSGEQLAKAIEKNGYSTDFREDYKGHYQFAKVGETVSIENGTAATMLKPHYAVNDPWFEYNAEDGLYYRFEYGDKQIDQLTNEQLTYKNVILQYCKWENYDDSGYLNIDTVTGGAGKFLTNGQVIDVTWKKDSEFAPARYYDVNGKEIKLNTGKTWVCIVQDTNADQVEILDGSAVQPPADGSTAPADSAANAADVTDAE